MRSGSMEAAASTTSGASPFLGGSTQITSGRRPRCRSSAASREASPHRNSTLSTPLRRALSSASRMASGTISPPMTCLARRASTWVMVPAPQYRSTASSRPVSPAYSRAFSYRRWAWSWFT